MLNMTAPEVRLRRGSLLVWRRYVWSADWMLTVEVVPVTLLAAVGSVLEHRRGLVTRYRIITETDRQLHDVDRMFLQDPTQPRRLL